MAALCPIGLHCRDIWKAATAVSHNLITIVLQKDLVNHLGQILALQIEIYTTNGPEFLFFFPVHDRALHEGILQVFPVRAHLSKAGCDQARTQMAQLVLNHRIYSDPLHLHRTIILMSTLRFDLSAFRQPQWREGLLDS